MNSIQASQIMGGNGAKARKAADLYPTPPEVTVALMRFLKLPGETVVWEPARGQGDMVRALANCGMAVYGMLARRDKAAAEIFKVSMMMAVGDPESPVWQDLKPDCLSIAQRVKPKEGKSDDK